MKSILKSMSVIGLALVGSAAFVSTSASAELFRRPRPVPSPTTVINVTQSGVDTPIALPAQVNYDEYGRPETDEYGRVIASHKKLTHFEIVVGPGSTSRGCVPASKADGYKSWTGVNSTWTNIAPTTLIDEVQRTVINGNRRETWTAYQFEVNGGVETPVKSINVFFPYDRKYGRVDCHFLVNLSLVDNNSPKPQYAAPASK